jgi:hypothetical protein
VRPTVVWRELFLVVRREAFIARVASALVG